MRFAGSPSVTEFLSQSMDHGASVQNAAATRSKINTAGTELQGQTVASGIDAAGKVEAAEILGAANAQLGQAQGQAAMMKGIGGIASSAIGAFGGAGGLGGGGGATSLAFDSSSIPTSAYTDGFDVGGVNSSQFLSMPTINW